MATARKWEVNVSTQCPKLFLFCALLCFLIPPLPLCSLRFEPRFISPFLPIASLPTCLVTTVHTFELSFVPASLPLCQAASLEPTWKFLEQKQS